MGERKPSALVEMSAFYQVHLVFFKISAWYNNSAPGIRTRLQRREGFYEAPGLPDEGIQLFSIQCIPRVKKKDRQRVGIVLLLRKLLPE